MQSENDFFEKNETSQTGWRRLSSSANQVLQPMLDHWRALGLAVLRADGLAGGFLGSKPDPNP
jgi:hypothetical protein